MYNNVSDGSSFLPPVPYMFVSLIFHVFAMIFASLNTCGRTVGAQRS